MEIFNELLGLDATKLNATQMAMRAVFVFFASFIYLRIAGVRTFGRKSIFDQSTLLATGSILGRSIVSDSPFMPSMLAVLILVLLHRLFAFISYSSKRARKIITGDPILLYGKGKFITKNLAETQVSSDDVVQSLRVGLHQTELKDISECYLEPSGDISIVKK